MALVAPAVTVARSVGEGAGVLVGAAKAVKVRSAAKVPTACVRISSGLTVTVGVSSGAAAPQALSNKAPIIKICNPTTNRNLSIRTLLSTQAAILLGNPFFSNRGCMDTLQVTH
jgi:hypothetical protein